MAGNLSRGSGRGRRAAAGEGDRVAPQPSIAACLADAPSPSALRVSRRPASRPNPARSAGEVNESQWPRHAACWPDCVTLRASGAAPLTDLVRLVAAELVSEVCSIYVQKPGDMLELAATEGLQPGRRRPHPAARRRGHRRPVRRHRRGDEPARRAEPPGLRLSPGDRRGAVSPRCSRCRCAAPAARSGVLAVQNRTPRHYTDEEVDELETVAMLLAELLPASGATDGGAEGVAATVPRVFAGTPLDQRHRDRSRGAARAAARAAAAARRRPGRGAGAAWTPRSSACSAGWTN